MTFTDEEPRQRMNLQAMLKAYWDFYDSKKESEPKVFPFDYLLICQSDYERLCKEAIVNLKEPDKTLYLEKGILYGVRVEVFENEDLLRMRANELAGKKIGIVGEPKTETPKPQKVVLNCALILNNPEQILRTIEVLCLQIDPHVVYMDAKTKTILSDYMEGKENYPIARKRAFNVNEIFGAEVKVFETITQARKAAQNDTQWRYILVDYQAGVV